MNVRYSKKFNTFTIKKVIKSSSQIFFKNIKSSKLFLIYRNYLCTKKTDFI